MVLWLILAVLLFGSGAVLGFFSTLFWIIVVISILGVVLWILFQTPRITKELVDEQKEAYRKHPVGVVFSFIIIAGFIIFWLITKQQNDSSGISTTEKLLKGQQTKTVDYQSLKGYAFPQVNRTAFTQSCIKEAGPEAAGISKAYCSCILIYIELNYSFKEFLRIEQEYLKTKKFPPDITAAINNCVNRAIKE